MSRNLCKSSCCGNVVRLSDLRGKPIEFRRYRNDAPRIGTKWKCPSCLTKYFVIWNDPRQFASSESKFSLDLSYYSSFNDEEAYDIKQMAEDVSIEEEIVPIKLGIVVHENYWQILEAWQQQNPNKPLLTLVNNPAHLCLDDAEDVQDIL